MLAFKSQTKRNTVLAVCFGMAIDVVVSYLIALHFDTGFPPLVVAVGLPIAVYIATWIYSMYVGLKEIAWFLLFERQARIELVHSQLLELNFPVPDSEYDNADDYFTKVALASNMPAKTALVAGQLMGLRYKRPLVQTICTNIVMERAIEKYRLTRQAAKLSAA